MQTISDIDFDWQEYDAEPEKGKIIPMSAVKDSVIDKMFGDNQAAGSMLPWDKAELKGLRIRPGEVSVYAGVNGNYKSMVTSQIALHLMRQGEKVCMASFEMLPQNTMARMARQATGTGNPSLQYVKRFLQWSDGKGLLYNHFGRCDPRKVLAVARYVAKEHGVRHFFMDSLMKVVENVDDYSGQKMFIEDSTNVAKQTGMHMHIVAHARKGAAETDNIDKFSIKGASEIGDLSDNLYLCQRNKRKERDAEKPDFDGHELPDFFFTVAKQRDGEFEGTLGLWFNKGSLCLCNDPKATWPPIYLHDMEDV